MENTKIWEGDLGIQAEVFYLLWQFGIIKKTSERIGIFPLFPSTPYTNVMVILHPAKVKKTRPFMISHTTSDEAETFRPLPPNLTPEQEEILSNLYRIFAVIPFAPPKSENRGRL